MIITKTIVAMLASIMPHLVPHEQRGFIEDRKTKDCIVLDFEAYNLLDSKS